MKTIEIARKFAAFRQVEDAQRAYALVIHESGGEEPEEELEAALYLLQSGGDYKVSYTCLQSLYNRGVFREESLDIMTQAFYEPNVKLQKARYEKNCKLLEKYPYLFRRDFPSFEALPVQFFPYDDNGYTPFYKEEERFGPYVDFKHPVVSRNFFKELDKPILAEDVYSQYELEYLNDNVRKSEWVGRENHIYLHYRDWGTFCSYLQCLNLRPLLEQKKIVFLIGEEIEQYPIDFKGRFGIDYSQFPVKPLSIREIDRLIWHTQFAAHNGGDFFNEIFYGHPNLLALDSIMFDNITEHIANLRKKIANAKARGQALKDVNLGPATNGNGRKRRIVDRIVMEELVRMNAPTDKDFLVAIFLSNQNINQGLDRKARIVPALFFQPHFPNMIYKITRLPDGRAVLESEQYEKIKTSPLFRDFKYIKTFSPIRRITTSYAATVRFMKREYDKKNAEQGTEEKGEVKSIGIIGDAITQRLLNRSYLIDWQDRLYKDSVLVRFEDGKLNPKATFTALAAFLDLPYTESMTYCSGIDGINPESLEGNVLGFDPAAVYRTYDEFANDTERYYLEYFTRDAYEAFGYDFHYYDGAPVDAGRVEELLEGFTTLDGLIDESFNLEMVNAPAAIEEELKASKLFGGRRLNVALNLLEGLSFINKNGQPLHMMPALQLDPALLEQPLYH